MRSFLPLLVGLSVGAAGAVGACSATTHTTFSSSGVGGGGGNGNNSGTESTGVGFGGFHGTGGSTAQGSCSADLQSIVDDKGNVVTMCPSDEGCAGGQCVPA